MSDIQQVTARHNIHREWSLNINSAINIFFITFYYWKKTVIR